MARPMRDDGRDAQRVATEKYNKKTYDVLTVRVKSGQLALVDAYAQQHGLSRQALINKLLANNVPGFEPIDPARKKGSMQ